MSTGSEPGRPTASLSRRLVVGALVWLALLLALGGGILAFAIRDTLHHEFGHRLDAMLQTVIAAIEIGPDGRLSLVRSPGDPRYERAFSGWYWQVSEPDGRLVRSRSLWDASLPTVIGSGEAHSRRAKGPRDEELLVVERELEFAGADGPIHVLVAGDLGEVGAGIRRFDALLMTALGLLGLGMAMAVVIQVRFGLEPLRAMRADLEAVRNGERARLAERYPGEVAPLARAMNAVLDNDADLIERARAHVGNLAHGLKTPLAVIGAEMAGVPDRQAVARQLQVMQRLIEHHLGRAQAVAGAGRTPGVRVPVGEIAETLAGALNRIFADRHLSIEVEVPVTAWFKGHHEDLEELLGNLMENACKWATSRVRVSADGSGDGLVIAVEDDGPGLSGDQAGLASARGSRLDEAAPGWGLGLAIVSDLVAVNGGDMTFGRSPLGGLMVTIRMQRHSP